MRESGNGEETLHQALLKIPIADIEKNSLFKYSYMKRRVDDMINKCSNINSIRKLFFEHGSKNF